MTKPNKRIYGIDKALKEGKVLYAFVSGCGGIVVRIEDYYGGRPLRGYGESYTLIGALNRASRAYRKTSSLLPYSGQDRLDQWVSQGHKLWAECINRRGGHERVKITACRHDYKPIVSAARINFETAYDTLEELVNDKAFAKAKRI